MRSIILRSVSSGLIAASLCVAVFAAPTLNQKEYQLIATLQAPEPEKGAWFGNWAAISSNLIVISEV